MRLSDSTRRSRILAAVLVFCAAMVTASSGQRPPESPGEWPGLWGPLRNGDARPGPAVATLRELWRRSSSGGYSEIAVAGDLAVTMELRDGQDFVVALDASTGRERWSARVGPTYRGHGGSDDGPIATPAVDGGDVFAAGPHSDLMAFDAVTGRERWRHNLARDFDATIPTWGYASSPLVEGDLVILPTGGDRSRGLLAFHRATGRLVWSAAHLKTPSYSSAVRAVIGGILQIVVAAGDRVFAVSPGDGRLLWSVPGPGPATEVANSPIVLPDDRVLLTYWNDAVLIKVTRDAGTLTAAEVWRSTSLRGANGPTIYRDGFLFGFAGEILVCLDAATGEVRWRKRTGAGTLVGAGPDVLLLGQASGDLHVVRATHRQFREAVRARVLMPDVRAVTGPSVAGTRLYVRNLREIAAFAIASR